MVTADWESSSYTAYVSQKATTDGYYRYVFAGTATTGAATVAGDYVDVR
ncbi:hypothetical protein [Streptomyces sp. NRRL B-3229]|nr:hypothetical protein [Streptomyces sp. NRRL B-3229]